MKIRELVISSAEFELRKAIREKLAESINKHLTSAVALFKARDNEDASDKGVNLDQLAQLVTGLKVLSKREHRDVITKDDVGVDPNNAKDLFALLDKVPDKPTAEVAKPQAEVFQALSALAPSLLKKEREELEMLLDRDPSKRSSAVNKLGAFATKVDQMFNQFHTAANKAASARPSATA